MVRPRTVKSFSSCLNLDWRLRQGAVSGPGPGAAGIARGWARPCARCADGGRARPHTGRRAPHGRPPGPAGGPRRAPPRSSASSRRPFQATSTPPVAKQRRRVLRQDRQRRQRPGGDDVVGLPARTAGPLLGPLGHRGGIAGSRGAGQALDHLALAPCRLHEVDPRGRQRHGKGQARKARPGADVGDARRPRHLRDVERDEAVRQVDPRGLRRCGDGGRRIRLGRERLEEAGKPLDLVFGQILADAREGQRFS